MSEKNVKLLRGQVRQAVKENLETELVRAVEERLNKIITERLSTITDMTREALDVIDKRSQDMQNYVTRNVAVPTAPPALTKATEEVEADEESEVSSR